MSNNHLRVVFYYPRPLNYENAKFASGLRPVKILAALKKEYEVFEIVGDFDARKLLITMFIKNVREGVRYDFVYCENTNKPIRFMGGKKMFFKRPNPDYLFFRFCKRQGIPVGVFYRDMFWDFSSFYISSKFKRLFFKREFLLDLKLYQETCSVIFVPSEPFKERLSKYTDARMEVLPPAADDVLSTEEIVHKNLSLIYVGGLGPSYRLYSIFDVVGKNPNLSATFVVRESDWRKFSNEYKVPENVSVVHAASKDLSIFYARSDLAILFFSPDEYMNMAMPYKLFEYIGYEKPIIVRQGTVAAKFVAEYEIGWVVDNDDDLEKLLIKLFTDRGEILDKKNNIRLIKKNNLWTNRILTIERTLLSSDENHK